MTFGECTFVEITFCEPTFRRPYTRRDGTTLQEESDIVTKIDESETDTTILAANIADDRQQTALCQCRHPACHDAVQYRPTMSRPKYHCLP